jgi:hypothetical protein
MGQRGTNVTNSSVKKGIPDDRKRRLASCKKKNSEKRYWTVQNELWSESGGRRCHPAPPIAAGAEERRRRRGAARLRWDAEAAVKAGGKEDGEVVPEGRVGCSAGGFGRAHGRGRDSAQDDGVDAEDDGLMVWILGMSTRSPAWSGIQ